MVAFLFPAEERDIRKAVQMARAWESPIVIYREFKPGGRFLDWNILEGLMDFMRREGTTNGRFFLFRGGEYECLHRVDTAGRVTDWKA